MSRVVESLGGFVVVVGCGVAGVWVHSALGGTAVAGPPSTIALTATIPAQETVGDCTCTCDGFSVRLAVEESQEPAP